MASDGIGRVMDIQPTELHQRTPLYLGSRAEVETVQEFPLPPEFVDRRVGTAGGA